MVIPTVVRSGRPLTACLAVKRFSYTTLTKDQVSLISGGWQVGLVVKLGRGDPGCCSVPDRSHLLTRMMS